MFKNLGSCGRTKGSHVEYLVSYSSSAKKNILTNYVFQECFRNLPWISNPKITLETLKGFMQWRFRWFLIYNSLFLLLLTVTVCIFFMFILVVAVIKTITTCWFCNLTATIQHQLQTVADLELAMLIKYCLPKSPNSEVHRYSGTARLTHCILVSSFHIGKLVDGIRALVAVVT